MHLYIVSRNVDLIQLFAVESRAFLAAEAHSISAAYASMRMAPKIKPQHRLAVFFFICAAGIACPGRSGPQDHARMLARNGYGVLLFDRLGEGASGVSATSSAGAVRKTSTPPSTSSGRTGRSS